MCINCASIALAVDVYDFTETIVHHKAVEQPEKIRQFTEPEIVEIRAAKEVVKKYWVSGFKNQYELFSSDYKKILKSIYKINNAREYEQGNTPTERVWLSQKYQKVELNKKGIITIVVLSHWDDEGYEGDMTYIFILAKEKGGWRIANIVN